MQELLQKLELRVKALIYERETYAAEKDALALKVMELQEELDNLKIFVQELKDSKNQEDQDVLMSSMIVEDIIASIDEQGVSH